MAEQLRTKLKKKAMLEALTKNLGLVLPSAKAVGIHTFTHYQWLKKDPKYKAEVDKMNVLGLDFAEAKLFQFMQGDDKKAVTANLFYLKTKGKSRGYIQSHDLTVKGMEPEKKYLTTEQQKELAKEILKTPDKENLNKKYDDFNQ